MNHIYYSVLHVKSEWVMLDLNDLNILYYECGCVFRLNEKRKLDSATLCDNHHTQLRLSEKSNKILNEPVRNRLK